MKRHFCTAILAVMSSAVMAQSTTFTEVWRLNSDDASKPWFPSAAAGPTVRGADWNPITNNVVVLSRTDNALHVLNGATGAEIGAGAAISGTTGGTFIHNLVAIAGDGAIYTSNLALNVATGNFKIYKFASETNGAATAVFDSTIAGGGRCGDTLEATGSGTGTIIYAGTNAAAGPHAYKFTTADGNTFTVAASLTVTALGGGTPITSGGSPARLGLGAGPGDVLWVDSAGVGNIPRKINTTSGATEAEIASAITGQSTIGYTEIGADKLVANGPGNFVFFTAPNTDGSDLINVWNVSNPANPVKVGQSTTTSDGVSTHTNGNGVGSVYFDNANKRVGAMVPANSITMWQMPSNLTNVGDWNLY